MITFERRKQDILSKQDKSSIGKVDKPIEELVNKINKSKNYYTTSSCSGRIVLIRDSIEKKPGLFLFRTHDKITFNQLKKELDKIKDDDLVIFKQEPCVLAIACKDMDAAGKLLYKAREKAGWKESGIMSMSGRVMVELRSTEKLALPIMHNNEVLVDNDFLKVLVKQSNQRLEKTWEKIENLNKLM